MGDEGENRADQRYGDERRQGIAAKPGGKPGKRRLGRKRAAREVACAWSFACGLHMSWQRLSSEQHSEQIGAA
ncbi:hypothetical protein D3C80_2083370 [compost metagenome]